MHDPDPRGLIAEAYGMEDISVAECRSIFLDWALGQPQDADIPALARVLLARFRAPRHPMTALLSETAGGTPRPRRRGGRARLRP
jgi:hypothetical protein